MSSRICTQAESLLPAVQCKAVFSSMSTAVKSHPADIVGEVEKSVIRTGFNGVWTLKWCPYQKGVLISEGVMYRLQLFGT